MALTFAKKAKDFLPVKSLKFMLHEHLCGKEPGRTIKNIHASDLTKPEGMCPRYYALHDVTETDQKDEWLTTSEQVTFHIGRVLQDAVVNWFADMGKAIGHWQCLGCGHLHEFQLRPTKCETCEGSSFVPKEVRFVSAVTGASCGVDMLLSLGQDTLTPVELKTMDKDQFAALVAPLSEHRLRTNLYLRIIAESDQPWSEKVNTKTAKIMYITKGGYGSTDPELAKWGNKEKFSPFKEYDVERSDKATDAIMLRAKVVKDFRDGQVGMPTGVCPTALSKRAVYCSKKHPCWSGQFPPEHDWSKEG